MPRNNDCDASDVGLLLVVVCLLVSAWLTWRFCDPTSRFHILDHPNDRSLHTRPTPRSGGVAILAGVTAGFGLIMAIAGPVSELWWLAPAVVAVAAVSFVDDRFGVPVLARLSVHVGAAALLLWGGFRLTDLGFPSMGHGLPVWLAAGASGVFIVWMTNLYNFMDGMDGFAAGMGVFGFGTFAILGWMGDHSTFAGVATAVAAASGGFLVFNYPPARIFMGDVGSSTLGLLAAGLSLWGARDGVLPLWLAVLVFSPFVVDATVTLARRLVRRERVWQAHRGHYYQRLVQLGWGHRRTVLWEYGLMLGASASAVWAVGRPPIAQGVVLGVWCLIYVGLAGGVHRLERRQTPA